MFELKFIHIIYVCNKKNWAFSSFCKLISHDDLKTATLTSLEHKILTDGATDVEMILRLSGVVCVSG